MAKYLVELAEKQVKTSTFSIEDKLPKLLAVLPSPLLLPTQEALTVALPFAFTGNSKEHNPFPVKVVTFSSQSHFILHPAHHFPLSFRRDR